LSQNLGTLTSWNPLGPSGPVIGLLYLPGDNPIAVNKYYYYYYYYIALLNSLRRDTVIGIAVRLGDGRNGVRTPKGTKIFFVSE